MSFCTSGCPMANFSGPGQNRSCGCWIPRAFAGSWRASVLNRKQQSAKENQRIYSDKKFKKLYIFLYFILGLWYNKPRINLLFRSADYGRSRQKKYIYCVSVKPPRGLNCGSGHETISQNLKYLSCSPREVFDTLGDGQKWSKVCK